MSEPHRELGRMDHEAETDYRFHKQPTPGGGQMTTNDDPYFQVTFGRRSIVFYRDQFTEELKLGAGFESGVSVETHYLLEDIKEAPPGLSKEDYARLILHRIRAAGAWERYSVVFTGPLGDAQPA